VEAKASYQQTHASAKSKAKEHYLLVDGYNVIFAWDELKELARISLDAARGRLMDILCNYQGFYKCVLIVVFDAYKVKGNSGEIGTYHNINVVYTKEAETADMYIEKVTKEIGRKEHVTVVTSDGMEQMIVAGHGAMRRSSREFLEDVRQMEAQIRAEWL
jgi:predicted RNA-binding protein with PIN domain